MSPVVERSRKREHGWWRPACLLLALLLLALPAVPFLYPVGFTTGSWTLFIHAAGPPAAGGSREPAWGVASIRLPGRRAVIRNDAGQEYRFAAPVTLHAVRVAGWGYYLAWGQGQRTR
jgi:hypothetical protein